MATGADEVFVLDSGQIRSLPARPFKTGLFGKTLEDALQSLLEKHPEIIPGKQIDPENQDPPRFFLLRREMPIGSGSLDHLFVDQRAILTLVEAKLIQNPESRREVIGQIMDYAANAVDAWGNGRAREKAVEFWNKNGKILDEEMKNWLSNDIDIEDFWNKVDDNLIKGKIRLIIAADEIQPEVRRIIEYLNSELKLAEIYGLELRCYGKDEKDSVVLVPRLIGQTQATLDQKGAVLWWTADQLRTAYEGFSERNIAERLLAVLEWAEKNGVFLPAKAKNPTFGLKGKSGDRIFTLMPDATLYWFLHEKYYPAGVEERDQLLRELKLLKMIDPSLNVDDVVDGRNLPRKLTTLTDDEFKKLLKIFSQFCSIR